MDGLNFSLKEAEKMHIRQVLEKTKWNKNQAVRILKISRVALDKKIMDYQIDMATKNHQPNGKNSNPVFDQTLNFLSANGMP
ncbi:MAG: helix-turn-helix domain-containing protein [bacterium]|nr:helix-turn-helix domain-containing protein [bacterium]